MNYSLLVAEDIPQEREKLCQMLKQRLGHLFTVLEAKDGTEALELFYRENPEVAILNIEISGLSGLEISRKIRESGNLCAIIFVSDSDSFFYAQQAITLRALEYILKPYEEEHLISAVQQAVGYINQLNSLNLETQHHFAPVSAEPPGLEDPRLTLVREDISNFIGTHYMEELSMKNVAHAMNYSDAYFCKLFKQCFHVTFSTYLNEYRIKKAREMMVNPRISIKDISYACGYTDSNYFSRVFKRITGQTPTEYRLTIIEKVLHN